MNTKPKNKTKQKLSECHGKSVFATSLSVKSAWNCKTW